MVITLIRTVVLYGVLIFAVRLMGKRQVGEMEPAEFVVTMLVANLAAAPMQENTLPLVTGLVPICTVLGLELILAVLSLKSIPVRQLLCGSPLLLIRDGKVDQRALKMSRVSMDELLQKLREKDVFDLKAIRHAVLETDGELSVLRRAEYGPPSARAMGVQVQQAELCYAVISDGKVQKKELARAGFDELWLQRELKALGLSQKDVFLFAADPRGGSLVIKKEG